MEQVADVRAHRKPVENRAIDSGSLCHIADEDARARVLDKAR
jgi:hypothetical protein